MRIAPREGEFGRLWKGLGLLVLAGGLGWYVVTGTGEREAEMSSTPVESVIEQHNDQHEPVSSAGIPEVVERGQTWMRAVSHRTEGNGDAVSAAQPDIPLIDLAGQEHAWDRTATQARVFVFISAECPISNRILPEVNRLWQEFQSQGLAFFLVHADAHISRRVARQHADEYAIGPPVVLDRSGRLVMALKPTHTPQAIVVSTQGELLYSGAIDDRHPAPARASRPVSRRWLHEAVQAVVQQQPLETPRTEPVGCLIETDGDTTTEGAITFAYHIAPLIQQHCSVCHRAGEVGPFPLETYEDVARRAEQIRLVVHERTMPPWKPVSPSPDFRDDLRLSERDMALLDSWLAAGKPLGDPAELPPSVQRPVGWRLGPPDLILEMPDEYVVPADGPDIYRYFVLPTELREDRLVRAVEFQPGNRRVVHHAGFWFDRTGGARARDQQDPDPGYSSFGGPGIPGWIGLGNWTPGTTPQALPHGTGRPLPAGADLVLQVHYHPTGKTERDRSRVGLYFAEPTADRLVAEIAVGDMTLAIPAGARAHTHHASYTLPTDVRLLDVYPHMHTLGRRLAAVATLPDGSRQSLIHIDDWNYAWQPRYAFRQPHVLPRGTRIDLECVYDNSRDNPYRLDEEPQTVYWGEAANEEMGLVYFQVLPVSPQDYGPLTAHNMHYYQQTLQSFWRLHQQRHP